ncbi:MAG: hypothetical protein HRU19_31375 [Pseudobacteriovorax sp.]|nr:hypothetical protein [Pseudobacteriovorax sp.]
MRYILLCLFITISSPLLANSLLDSVKESVDRVKNYIDDATNTNRAKPDVTESEEGEEGEEEVVQETEVEEETQRETEQKSEAEIIKKNKKQKLTPRKATKKEGRKQTAKKKKKKSSWVDYLLLEPAENQTFGIGLLEGISLGKTGLNDNELQLGFYKNSNIISVTAGLHYGSTEIESEDIIDDNLSYEVDVDHIALSAGLGWYREMWSNWYPHVGLKHLWFRSDITKKVVLRNDEDSIGIPEESQDLKNFTMTEISFGLDYKIHLLKVLTAGAGVGVDVPISSSKIVFKNSDTSSDPEFSAYLDTYKKRKFNPRLDLHISFGMAI